MTICGPPGRPQAARSPVSKGREAAVEADHEPVVAGLGDRIPHRRQLVGGDRKRLLDEHGLAGAQRRADDRGMTVVPGRDQDRIDLRIGEQAMKIGRGAGKAELSLRVGRGQ